MPTNTENTANLLIVNMIEGFVEEGPLADRRHIGSLLPKQVDFLCQAKNKIAHVIFACDSHSLGDVEFERFGTHCLKGSDEAKICPELIAACDVNQLSYDIVEKRTHSPFYQTVLDKLIEKKGLGKKWFVIGCATDICVMAAVLDLLYRGNEVIIISDLVGTFDSKGGTAKLINALCVDYLFSRLGVKVKASTEL